MYARKKTKRKAKTFIERHGFKDNDLTTPKHDSICMWLDDNMKDVIDQLGFGKSEIENKIWEHPIVEERHYYNYNTESNQKVSEQIIGFVDMCCITKSPRNLFMFEVKSLIPSLGELLRELRFYKKYTTRMIIVVSPDDRFREKIEEQGFNFIKSPDFSKIKKKPTTFVAMFNGNKKIEEQE